MVLFKNCVEINNTNTIRVEMGGESLHLKELLSHKLLLCLDFQRTYIKEILFWGT